METLILSFAIYSFLGWCSEVVYCYIIGRKLTNRGFLYGPVCPVYGFGALLVIALLRNWGGDFALIFFMGMLITSALEYLTSWLLEVFFQTKWWDYSRYRFNIHGRVCLRNSILFGLLCVLLMNVLNPLLEYLIIQIPQITLKLSSIIILSLFVVDSAFTLNSMFNLNERLKKLHELTEDLKNNSEIIEWFNEHELFKSFERLKVLADENKNELIGMLRDRLVILNSRKGSGNRLIKAFPSMKSKKYDIQLTHLKDMLADIRNKTKNRRHK